MQADILGDVAISGYSAMPFPVLSDPVKNSCGILNAPTSFQFTVRPPWYDTRWAYIVYAILLLTAIIGINRVQRNMVIAKERHLLPILWWYPVMLGITRNCSPHRHNPSGQKKWPALENSQPVLPMKYKTLLISSITFRRSIVKAHDGEIEVNSEENEGTTFIIVL